MTPLIVLVVYSALIMLASVGGGLIPLLVRLTHQRMQLALSFVAGAMLGVGLLHMLPHALVELRSIDRVVVWTLAGFLTMFFVERFFAFHHHDISEDEHEHVLECQDHTHHHERPLTPHRLSWSGAAIGLSLHSLTEGIALAASVESEANVAGAAGLAGLATFLVVFLHKPFDSMTVGTLLAAAGFSNRARHWINLAFALLIPAGAILFLAGMTAGGSGSSAWLGVGLAFSAGTFLCIASSDLLPELQFHQHDRGKLSAALVVGVLAAWTIGLFEHHGHDHDPGHGHEHGHNHAHEHGEAE